MFKVLIVLFLTTLFVSQNFAISELKLPIARLVFYHGENLSEFQPYALRRAKDILAHPDFDELQPTVLYISDCHELNDESTRVVVDSYLRGRDYNVLALDWSAYNRDDFFNLLLPSIKTLAKDIADNILSMVNNGLILPKLHLVGFSLGAHVAGLSGRYLSEKTNGELKLTRVTGLDPSINGFFVTTLSSESLNGLSSSDASFVDVIHTDSGFHGVAIKSGTVDFWPNYGHRYQPGCATSNVYDPELASNDLCSHKRSYLFWAESVATKDKTTFLAVEAKSYETFRNGTLNLSRIALMGIDCSLATDSGNYYLQTGSSSPYSLGVAGLRNFEF